MATQLHLNNRKLLRLAEEIVHRAQKLHEQRYILAIAGIPGSGKTTLATKLLNQLDRVRPGVSRLIPMDGFHYANQVLEKKKIRHLKGKPETMDARGYVQLIKQAKLKSNQFHFPLYDRTVHEPIWSDTEGQHVHQGIQIILTEGNYLLLKQSPWNQLHMHYSRSWFLDCDTSVSRERLMARHQVGGRSWSRSCIHYAVVDYANTNLILKESRAADDVIVWGE